MSERPESGIFKLAEPIHLTTSLNAKGKIQFEISIHGATAEDIKKLTADLEDWVRARYGKQLAGASEE